LFLVYILMTAILLINLLIAIFRLCFCPSSHVTTRAICKAKQRQRRFILHNTTNIQHWTM